MMDKILIKTLLADVKNDLVAQMKETENLIKERVKNDMVAQMKETEKSIKESVKNDIKETERSIRNDIEVIKTDVAENKN